jgi:hypothetical protein
MMALNLDRVRANVQAATTEDLLNRATVYRPDMEPQAIDIIEAELRRRGVWPEQIEEHAERREREVVRHPDGSAAKCSFCHAPAVAQGWGWHRIWGKIPAFPRFFAFCEEHRPK